MRIIDLEPGNTLAIEQAARLLMEEFCGTGCVDWLEIGDGRALVEDLEEQARRAGAWTVWLGSDDENSRTSLGGIDLYPDPLGALTEIQSLSGHPYEFYLGLGYSIVGVLPDANGFGKPDIFLAKRIRDPESQS